MSEQSLYDLALQSQAIDRAIQTATPRDANYLNGILNLLDSIRDQVCDHREADGDPGEVVFPFIEDEDSHGDTFEVKEPE
jgi:hypothetical protein